MVQLSGIIVYPIFLEYSKLFSEEKLLNLVRLHTLDFTSIVLDDKHIEFSNIVKDIHIDIIKNSEIPFLPHTECAIGTIHKICISEINRVKNIQYILVDVKPCWYEIFWYKLVKCFNIK